MSFSRWGWGQGEDNDMQRERCGATTPAATADGDDMPLINVPTAPPTGAPTAATTTTASTTTAASTSTPDSGALEEQDGADFVVVDPGEYSYAFDASYSYSYAGTDSPGEMIFDADFDFGEFTAPDEGAFNAEDTVLISEPVASDCAAKCAGRRRRLRFGSFRGVGDCEC